MEDTKNIMELILEWTCMMKRSSQGRIEEIQRRSQSQEQQLGLVAQLETLKKTLQQNIRRDREEQKNRQQKYLRDLQVWENKLGLFFGKQRQSQQRNDRKEERWEEKRQVKVQKQKECWISRKQEQHNLENCQKVQQSKQNTNGGPCFKYQQHIENTRNNILPKDSRSKSDQNFTYTYTLPFTSFKLMLAFIFVVLGKYSVFKKQEVINIFKRICPKPKKDWLAKQNFSDCKRFNEAFSEIKSIINVVERNYKQITKYGNVLTTVADRLSEQQLIILLKCLQRKINLSIIRLGQQTVIQQNQEYNNYVELIEDKSQYKMQITFKGKNQEQRNEKEEMDQKQETEKKLSEESQDKKIEEEVSRETQQDKEEQEQVLKKKEQEQALNKKAQEQELKKKEYEEKDEANSSNSFPFSTLPFTSFKLMLAFIFVVLGKYSVFEKQEVINIFKRICPKPKKDWLAKQNFSDCKRFNEGFSQSKSIISVVQRNYKQIAKHGKVLMIVADKLSEEQLIVLLKCLQRKINLSISRLGKKTVIEQNDEYINQVELIEDQSDYKIKITYKGKKQEQRNEEEKEQKQIKKVEAAFKPFIE